MSKPESYQGKKLTVSFDGKRCIHSRNCVLGLPQVFRANVAGSWIVPDSAAAEDLAALIRSCPSGALSYRRHDGAGPESVPPVNVIRVLENGPLALHADLHIDGQQPTFRAVLCRCGASQNKPYCDGSHKQTGFIATGEPSTRESKPLEQRDGMLRVSPTRDGPLVLEGNTEICSGTGRTITRTRQAALCRCGGSSNKPFCDGSHAVVGFKAD